ncbi:MAG: ABC transporter substrate-binding protein [Nitrospirota bacterium]
MNTVLKPFRILLLLCLLALCSIAISGCTEKVGDTRTTIHFITWKPNIPGVWEEIFSIFETDHPELKVERETGPHSSTAFHDLLTQKLKNKSKDVDVFLMDVIWPPEFAAAGWAAPLDDLFPPSEQSKFLGGTILANTYKGKIYGIPLFIDSGILYYRKDLLDKYGYNPPDTWTEMIEQANVIVLKEAEQGNNMFGFSGQFKQYEGLICDMMEYILSNGGEILNAETEKSGLADKPALDAVRFVRDNIIGKAAPAGVVTYQEPESLDVFLQGKAVFHRNWPYAWEVSNNPERSRVAGNVGISRLPHFKGNRSYSTLGGWQVGISSYSENREAAWTLAKFLTTEKVQKILAIKSGKAPTRKVLYNDSGILEANPHFADMKDVFLTSYPRPRTPLYPAVSNVLQRYFSKAISDNSIDLKNEAAAASKEIEKIIALEKSGKQNNE